VTSTPIMNLQHRSIVAISPSSRTDQALLPNRTCVYVSKVKTYGSKNETRIKGDKLEDFYPKSLRYSSTLSGPSLLVVR